MNTMENFASSYVRAALQKKAGRFVKVRKKSRVNMLLNDAAKQCYVDDTTSDAGFSP